MVIVKDRLHPLDELRVIAELNDHIHIRPRISMKVPDADQPELACRIQIDLGPLLSRP